MAEPDGGERRVMCIVSRQLVGEADQPFPVHRIGAVYHVALGRVDRRAAFIHQVHGRMILMQPDRSRRSTDAENHLEARTLYLVEDAIEPGEFKSALLRLEGVPTEIAHSDDLE